MAALEDRGQQRPLFCHAEKLLLRIMEEKWVLAGKRDKESNLFLKLLTCKLLLLHPIAGVP